MTVTQSLQNLTLNTLSHMYIFSQYTLYTYYILSSYNLRTTRIMTSGLHFVVIETWEETRVETGVRELHQLF